MSTTADTAQENYAGMYMSFAKVYICDYHHLAFSIEKAGARAYLPHLYPSGGLEHAARG